MASQAVSKESTCHSKRCRRCRFNLWVREGPLGEEMETHSSMLAWGTPWTEEPGRLQSTGSQRVRYHWATEHACARTHTHVIWNINPYCLAHACSVSKSCLTLFDPMDSSLPGSSVHEISHAWLGCHFLLQGIFPTQGLNPASAGFFTNEPPGKL